MKAKWEYFTISFDEEKREWLGCGCPYYKPLTNLLSIISNCDYLDIIDILHKADLELFQVISKTELLVRRYAGNDPGNVDEYKWTTTDHGIPENEWLLLALWVTNGKTFYQELEKFLLYYDSETGSLKDEYGDYFSSWELNDFDYYCKMPNLN